jgi:hypothetical protein
MSLKITVLRCFKGDGNKLRIADIQLDSLLIFRGIKLWKSKSQKGSIFMEWPTMDQTDLEKKSILPKLRAVAFCSKENTKGDPKLTVSAAKLQKAIIDAILKAPISKKSHVNLSKIIK